MVRFPGSLATGRFGLALWLTIVASGVFSFAHLAAADEPLPIGLVKDQPPSGAFVKTSKGFMVAYKATIPGTEIEFEMVPIPGGKFKLGSPPSEADRDDKEGPQVEVTVEPFWMGKYEITWGEYKQYMAMHDVFKKFETNGERSVTDANRADAVTAPSNLYEPTYTFEKGDAPRLPAVSMTQYAAKQYTKWLTGLVGQVHRLPSEAEWEYACRAGTTTAYFWGDDPKGMEKYAWCQENSEETPHEVGQKQPNPWGLHDIHGNVWEWCLDQVLPDGYARLEGKSVSAMESVAWPVKAWPRALRGGGWEHEAKQCRAASRLSSNDKEWKDTDPNTPKSPWWFTDEPALSVGFRIVRPLETPTKEELVKLWEPDVDAWRSAIKGRLTQGRGALGLVDRALPEAIKKLEK